MKMKINTSTHLPGGEGVHGVYDLGAHAVAPPPDSFASQGANACKPT